MAAINCCVRGGGGDSTILLSFAEFGSVVCFEHIYSFALHRVGYSFGWKDMTSGISVILYYIHHKLYCKLNC